MNNKLRFTLIFLGSGVAMLLIFYFYPAQLFDAEIYGLDGGFVQQEISLRAFLGDRSALPDSIIVENVTAVKGKVSGWLILIIITIGMPLMFAYRSIVQKRSEKAEE